MPVSGSAPLDQVDIAADRPNSMNMDLDLDLDFSLDDAPAAAKTATFTPPTAQPNNKHGLNP